MSNDYANASRDRLKRIIGKKFDTATIFPLGQFETAFGHLWGHGKPREALTDEEVVYRQKWEECRKNILDNGHRQRRNSNTELDMHEVKWLRYNATLTPIKREVGENNGS